VGEYMRGVVGDQSTQGVSVKGRVVCGWPQLHCNAVAALASNERPHKTNSTK
jgi:hypothetical protein